MKTFAYALFLAGLFFMSRAIVRLFQIFFTQSERKLVIEEGKAHLEDYQINSIYRHGLPYLGPR